MSSTEFIVLFLLKAYGRGMYNFIYIYIYSPLPSFYTGALVQLTVGLIGVFIVYIFLKSVIVSGFGCKLTYSIFSSLCIIRWALLKPPIYFWNLLVKSPVIVLKLSLLIKSKIFS